MSIKTPTKWIIGACIWIFLAGAFVFIMKVMMPSGSIHGATKWKPVSQKELGFSVPEIAFARGSNKIREEDYSVLDQFSKDLKAHPQLGILITGHAMATTDFDHDTAETRAKSVLTYLLSDNVDRNSIIGLETKLGSSSQSVTFAVMEKR